MSYGVRTYFVRRLPSVSRRYYVSRLRLVGLVSLVSQYATQSP